MAKTKEKILQAALLLFNRDGLVNVRLQHIADEAFVSVGNLAYHYSNKEAIVLKLYENLAERQAELMREYRSVPLFASIDRLFRLTFQLQETYRFFYLDTLEVSRAYPSVAERHQQQIQSQITQLHHILQFNVARGALLPGEPHWEYGPVAHQIWMMMDLWRLQNRVQFGEEGQEEIFLKTLWSLLKPYFSDMGRQEYRQMLNHPYDFFF